MMSADEVGTGGVFRELAAALDAELRVASSSQRLRKTQKEFGQLVVKNLTKAGFRPGDVRDLEGLVAELFAKDCALTARRVCDAFESEHLSDVFEKLIRLREKPQHWRWMWDFADRCRGENGEAIRAALYRNDSARALFLIEGM